MSFIFYQFTVLWHNTKPCFQERLDTIDYTSVLEHIVSGNQIYLSKF